MIHDIIHKAISNQINKEFAAAYMYLSIANELSIQGFPGMEHWYKKQYEEELEHAHKFIDHLLDRDVRPILYPINLEHKVLNLSPRSLTSMSLDAERAMSKELEKLYDLSLCYADYKLTALLNWFMEEQVEEERLFTDLLDSMRRVVGDGPGLEYLDREMAKRD